MKLMDKKLHELVIRFLVEASPCMKLSRTAYTVLAVLYIQKCNLRTQLTVEEICDIADMSASTVSVTLSLFESLNIISKHVDRSSRGKGRKRMLISLKMEVYDLFKLGVVRIVTELQKILSGVESISKYPSSGDGAIQAVLDCLMKDVIHLKTEILELQA